MRLPAVTQKHRETEDARAFHEAVWAAHLRGERLVIPTGDVTAPRAHKFGQQAVWNKGSFWARRGYRLHVKTTGAETCLWLELGGVLSGKKIGESMGLSGNLIVVPEAVA